MASASCVGCAPMASRPICQSAWTFTSCPSTLRDEASRVHHLSPLRFVPRRSTCLSLPSFPILRLRTPHLSSAHATEEAPKLARTSSLLLQGR